jgi:hypothetical protein
MISGIKLQGTNGKFTPPMFSHIYHLTTVEMSNKKGTWSTWSVSKVGPVKNQQVYELAKNFADSVYKQSMVKSQKIIKFPSRGCS